MSDITAAQYHSEEGLPGDVAYFSKSIGHVILTQSPAHAEVAHPRLNPHYVRIEDDKFSIGSAVHGLLLEGDAGVYVIQEDSYRTASAKEAREYARSMGKIPLLAKHLDAVQEMTDAIRTQAPLFDCAPPLLSDGKPEVTITWRDKFGVLCKARLDWLHDDLTANDDIKTTSRSAAPEAWSRTAVSIGADLQAALYQRGMRAVYEKDVPIRFVVVETSPPYAMSVFEIGPDALALANEKLDYALSTWAACLKSGSWPAYPRKVVHITAPAWAEGQWYEREERDA